MKCESLFIAPKENIEKGDDRLTHFTNLKKVDLQKRWQTETGRDILGKWLQSGYQRDTLESLVGKCYDHVDLRGIDLSGVNLQNTDLRTIDFYGANLQGCCLEQADLTDSWLSESNLRGTKLNWAKMDGTLLDKVEFDTHTTFYGVNLSNINFTLAALLRDLAIGQQRIHQLEEQHPALAFCFRVSCDYGRSFRRFGGWVGGIIAFFAIIYTVLPEATNAASLWDNFYFSVITFTTLGYGDIHPVSALGKSMVCVEVILGYLMLGLLVAMSSKRVIGN